MRHSTQLLGICLLFIASSCQLHRAQPHLNVSSKTIVQTSQDLQDMEQANIVAKRFEDIRQNIEEGHLETAEKELILLQALPGYELQKQTLQQLIDNAKVELSDKSKLDLSKQRMLNETNQRYMLPENYGKVLVIDSNLEPLEMPTGAMEELVNRKISVHMDSAGIKELVQVLSREGLNVVADEALESGKKLSISVKDVPLKELFAYVARNMGVAFHLGENLIWITKGETDGGAQLETRIIRLRQGLIPKVPAGAAAPGSELPDLTPPEDEEDNDLEEALKTFFTGSPEGAAFRLFRNRNILMVRDSRENLRLIEDIVRELDQPPYQVVIEARFITVSQDDLRDLGVEWSAKYTSNKEEKDGIKDGSFLTQLGASSAAADIGTGTLTLSGVIGNHTFDVLISAIEKQNSATTLSAPRVTVLNNRTARLRKGDKYYYFEEYDVSSVDRGDQGTIEVLVPTGKPAELPVGITFDVKVNVGNDGKTVLLGLKPAIMEFKGWENYLVADDTSEGEGESNNNKNKKSDNDDALTPIKLPRTHEQVIMTSVEVASGETVILGGLINNVKTKNQKKVPFLGDLPLLGVLFRRTETTSIPTNLLIFVTANVVSNSGQYMQVR
ncbi:MAG: type II secretion system protein GspD [Oligosphaeraceae bacterium]|nr:type II secretion system protein GspD [Oligosphaeraceae bacterium]